MLDEQTNLLLQIELNTISSSFPGLSCLVSELHRLFQSIFLRPSGPSVYLYQLIFLILLFIDRGRPFSFHFHVFTLYICAISIMNLFCCYYLSIFVFHCSYCIVMVIVTIVAVFIHTNYCCTQALLYCILVSQS